MPLIKPGFRWKTVQTVEWEWYWRFSNFNTYTVDMTLPTSVDPARCILKVGGQGGYHHNEGGTLYGNVELINSDTIRASYLASKGQKDDGSTQGPYGPVPVTVYESSKPFKSSQFITSYGSSILLAQAVDWNRAMLIRNWFTWSASLTLGFWLKPVDDNHIAQGSYPNFGNLQYAESFYRAHIVEF